ncbi:MAG TPA: cytidylate kinase-like family protein [Dehalococcoidia bacterium]|jgi:cytidylate kinase|nr:cytidylate kinase-like family protein [Dehalococcoidia bacterium]HIK89829.1 cytidylate kinase-like family protein [Dehalococcoidia bacterium]
MSVITIDGHIGAGGLELGKRVARMFDLHYVDRIALPRSITDAKGIAPVRTTDRIWALIERAVSGFALGNAAGDPYFNVPESLLLPLTWDSDGPSTAHADEIAAPSVDNLFDLGNAVLVHRAGVVEAGDRPALKVGLFASWEDRVERIMKREGLKSTSDAEYTIERREKLQREYFGGIHGVEPDDRSLYDIVVDTSAENIPVASIKVARFAREALALQTA